MSNVIVYDHFIAYGGAENVSLLLQKRLKNAHIECAWADPELFAQQKASGILRESGLTAGSGPISSLRLMFFYLFCYSLPGTNAAVISGLFAPLCLLKKQPAQKKILYFHMFPVFLNWSFAHLCNHYGLFIALLMSPVIKLYARLLKAAARRACAVYSNSHQARCKFAAKGIITELLYPPVSTEGFSWCTTSEYFLSTARLEESKRVRLIAEVFKEMPEQNIIFIGGGTLLEEFRRTYADCQNIKFVGWVQLSDVKRYYSQAKSLIYIPENEAFGIAPVEAFAAGIPVIGVAEAGLLETIDDPRLGRLLTLPLDKKHLKSAVNIMQLEDTKPDDVAFRKARAKLFDSTRFFSVIETAIGV